ncbi:hypothetical protein [Caminibacter pacificus]|uniref:hypothetical protein n=1 Tax=Caminibacter pacificus TaxID=1424653 RepID=UPI0010AC42A3|nr:hypothetical protein [Caminibacter pacificus]NPA88007.1 hypothetical protein [Campylobacterota bacterium]
MSKKEKETNNTIIQEEFFIRKWLIDKYNAIVPSFLEGEPKENMLNFTVGYDTKNNKPYSKLKINILLPQIERKFSKQSLKTAKTSTIKVKLLPILQIYKRVPTLTIKWSLTYKQDSLTNQFKFNESIYYYTTFTEYKEITTISVQKFIAIENLLFLIQKSYYSTDKTNMYYKTGIYYYTDFYKFIRTYGYEMGGEREKLPFIYWYKLFFTYRHILFDRRYLFMEFTPYLYYSKEYDFHPKLFLNVSFNVKF